MRKCFSIFFLLSMISIFALSAEDTLAETFTSFTGKVLKNKVRLRAGPSLDSQVIREVNQNDMFIITGEYEDFFSVRPPADMKAYIFRTYVLDGIVEGNHVNVRLEPDTDALVLAQLNSGDHIIGDISADHGKWLAIQPPEGVNFFISKDYIEKIGDHSLLNNFEKRRNEVSTLLEASFSLAELEIQKPFEQIALTDVYNNLNTVISNYSEFSQEVESAKALKQAINDQYLQKKISHLEAKSRGLDQAENEPEYIPLPAPGIISSIAPSPVIPAPSIDPETVVAIATPPPAATTHLPTPSEIDNVGVEPNMVHWLTVEADIYSSWSDKNDKKPLSDFYEEQRGEAITLRGTIEPYNRPVRNKPGDYVLLNRVNRLPVAFLYSTVVNLGNFEEQEVTIQATERPNNNFAFPAYFVLSVK